jgi:hypothetical protein
VFGETDLGWVPFVIPGVLIFLFNRRLAGLLLDWTFKPFWVPQEKRLSYVRAVMVLIGLSLIGLSIFVLLAG